MDVTPVVDEYISIIESYGSDNIVINSTKYTDPVLVEPLQVTPLNDLSLKDLEKESSYELVTKAQNCEILLVGTGKTHLFISPAIRNSLKSHGIILDAMDTGAACRTFNILISEERPVAALLFPFM